MSLSPPPSDSPPSSSSPPPSSPPPSSPPPSSPPPSSPPPSSPPPSSPPPSSPPPSSPPPSSPPSNSSSSSPPPPQDSSNSSPPPPPNSQSSPPPPPTPSPPHGEFRPPPPPPPRSSNDSPSPPPPPRSLSSSSKISPSSSGGSDSSNVGVIAGVAVGVALVLAILIAIFVACFRKKKKRQQPTPSSYFADSGPQGGQYYNHTPSEHNNNWQSGPKTSDHVVGMSSGTPGGAGWPMPPPPPPPHMCSSDMSSNFSGPHGPPLPPPPLPASMAFNKNTFTYDELVAATSGFAQSNLLGQGGFGYVHKGVLPNGKEIAVKCLKSGSGQGDREFQAEVEIISRVHHRHLVSLVGYCIAGGRKLLVYEFLPNNNLEVHLHAAKDRPALDWSSRFKIAMGSAKGLAYLHEDCHPRIIHRDIKTSNILLDFNFEPKVSDFGLAKLSQDNNTHVSTRVMGTFGYLAPEYASSGKLTDKSDVFSFGVMLLELITGRRPVDTTGDYMEDSLVDWARPICMRALEDGNYDRDHLVDIRLDNNYDKQEMARMVACASASIRHSARRRPKMSQIVRALEGDVSLEDLNEGAKPGQSSYFGGVGSSNTSSDYEASSYSADMKKFRKLALDSQNYGSSEYGATSEYGLNPSSSSESSGEISSKGTRLHNNNA